MPHMLPRNPRARRSHADTAGVTVSPLRGRLQQSAAPVERNCGWRITPARPNGVCCPPANRVPTAHRVSVRARKGDSWRRLSKRETNSQWTFPRPFPSTPFLAPRYRRYNRQSDAPVAVKPQSHVHRRALFPGRSSATLSNFVSTFQNAQCDNAKNDASQCERTHSR